MLPLPANLWKRPFQGKRSSQCRDRWSDGIPEPYGKGLGGKVSALEEIKEKYGFDAHAIVTMQDVIDHLYNKPYKGQVYIDDTLKKAIDEYYAVYGA